jgi:hypothetical protein
MINRGAGSKGFDEAVNAKSEAYGAIANFYTDFPKIIGPYVRMDQKSP